MAPRLDLPLIPSTKAPRRARHAISELLDRSGRPDLCPDTALLVTELVTNAVTHAGGPIGVSAGWVDDALRVEVHDFEPSPPVLRHPSILEESGRGLCLVAELHRAHPGKPRSFSRAPSLNRAHGIEHRSGQDTGVMRCHREPGQDGSAEVRQGCRRAGDRCPVHTID